MRMIPEFMAFPAEVVSCLLKSQTVWPGCRPSICPMNAAPPGETCSVGDVIETVNGTLGCLFSPQCHTVRAFVTTATTIPPKAVSTPVQIAALTALSRPDCVVGPGRADRKVVLPGQGECERCLPGRALAGA